jgi:hypothetical protein
MSQPNEPPLALDSWSITVKLNDGSDFKLEPDDLSIATIPGIQEAVDEAVEFRIDHLRGKYAGEVEDALNPLGKYKLVDEKKSD